MFHLRQGGSNRHERSARLGFRHLTDRTPCAMSTTNALAVTRTSLRSVICAMSEGCPSMNAAPGEVAAWFERGVELLRPITRDRSHPEHDEACVLAAKYCADARAARAPGRAKGVTR